MATCVRTLEIIQPVRIGRERGQVSIAFKRNLPLAFGIVDPQGTLAFADRRDEGLAVGSERNAIFLGYARGDLLRRAIRKALAPDVESVSGVGGKIHPLLIRRPARKSALSWRRTGDLAFGTPVERD